ncbi:MAG: glycosyltransferase family 2 protein [Psychroflexus sp.]
MKLSIVILNYKVPHHLMLCLDSVSRAIESIDAEIIVVDNNSEDESCELVEKNFPGVLLISNSKNLGFSKGNNIGVKKAKGEFLCILNPDTVVPEDCFTKLFDHHQKVKNPGVIGVQLIDGSGEFLEESKRNIPTPQVALKKLSGNCSSYYNFNLAKEEDGPTDILVGAFMFMKTKLYLNIGGFDEDYFMYGEDIDLSYRILKAGYQNYYLGSTKVLHFKGESTTKDQVYLNRFYNAMYIFYKKHFKNYKTTFRLVNQIFKVIIFFEIMKLKSIEIQSLKFNEIHLISENKCLQNKIKAKLNSEINVITKTNSELENAFIIIDANCLQYSDSIKVITDLKSKNNAFRIKPRNYNFMIGSESKHLKGEVIDLS